MSTSSRGQVTLSWGTVGGLILGVVVILSTGAGILNHQVVALEMRLAKQFEASEKRMAEALSATEKRMAEALEAHERRPHDGAASLKDIEEIKALITGNQDLTQRQFDRIIAKLDRQDINVQEFYRRYGHILKEQ